MGRVQAAPSNSITGRRVLARAAAERGRSLSDRPSIALRLTVFMTRAKLDRAIVGRHGDGASEALRLRVRQLTEPRTHRQIARELHRVVEHADRYGSAAVKSCVIVERAAVRAGREAILGLAERLESDTPASAAGIVLARALLTDAISPLRNPYCRQSVSEAIFAVQDALGGYSTSPLDVAAT